MDYAGKIAVITGGTTGIGKATAILFRDRGARVIATALDQETARQHGADPALDGIEIVVLDVTDNAAAVELAGKIGPIDLLVNSAGTQLRGPAAFEEEGFTTVLDVNLNGTMRCCRAFYEGLAKRKGAIINIGSVTSFVGTGTAPGYAASKGAIVQLTKSLAVAWADAGIRVNAVAPGFIRTPMTDISIDPAKEEQILSRTLQRRWGRAEFIAEAIAFLGSSRAEFITGVTLPVDGGYTAH